MTPVLLRSVLLLICGLSLASAHRVTAALPQLKVSPDKHHLVTAKGKPFFYLGDTAWELFHRLTREDAEFYLKTRAKQGFTVIQAVALAEYDLTLPNAYGKLALEENDPLRPNEAYFAHVDWIVNRAERHGLYVGFLPTWGDKWNKKWGKGPEIFTPKNAEAYGEWLGKRYRDKPIIWILGGDRPIEREWHSEIIRAMAKGLARGDGGTHLMTFHPQGGKNSSEWFHQDAWLDFNMFQSGHAMRDIPNYEFNLLNLSLKPEKPTLDGEPRYEDHPVRRSKTGEWFDAFDTRQAAYWSMLSGACGHTYGNHNIWQFLSEQHPAVTMARTPWKTAIEHPGAKQMGIMRTVFEKFDWQKLEPDQALLQSDPGSEGETIRAARANDGGLAFVYSPMGKSFSIDGAEFSGKRITASWHDPRTGKRSAIGGFPAGKSLDFTPPSNGRGNDWLLILEAGR